jgi:predicted phage terminase large subunit-like protein
MIAPEIARLTASDFRLFAKRMWAGVSADPFQPGYHFDCICEHLQAVADREISRLALLCPVRHSKSILSAVLFPAFLWVRNPSERIITATYSQQLTVRDAVRTRQLLESDLFRSYFGPVAFSDDANRKDFYANTSKGHRLSVSTNSRVAGFDADVVIQDDVISLQDRHSETERNAALDFFSTSLCSRLVKTGREAIVLCGHRYHEDDLFAHLRKQYGDDGTWTWCVLPAEHTPKFSTWFNGIGWKDIRAEGESLWKERYGDYSAEKKSHRHEFSAIFQQEPTPKEGTLFKSDWFAGKTWTEEGENYNLGGKLYPKSKAWRFLTCDTAISTNPEADYTVCQCWDVVGPNLVLVDQLRGKFDGTKIVPKLVAFYNRYQPQFVAVEKEFVGRFVLDQLREQNLLVKGFDAKGHGDKEQRAGAKAIGFEIKAEGGQIWLPGASWVSDWLSEVLAFPFGSHDDQVDCASMACILTGKYNQPVQEAVSPEEQERLKQEEERERFNRMMWADSGYIQRFRR